MQIQLIMITDATEMRGDAVLAGPHGALLLRDLTWCPEELWHHYYWYAWAATQGIYHCCWSLPGKVTLLPPDDPRCRVC